jgi:hypothetical protein
MDLMVALENGKTWTTKEGKTIPINELEDKHLLNIMNMLMVRAPLIKERVVLEIIRFSDCVNGEMAQLAIDQEIRKLENADDIVVLYGTPLYDALRKEAKKRGLKVE